MQEPEVANERGTSATGTHADRRRPGRVEYRSSSLIGLLRAPSHQRDDSMDAVPQTGDARDQERKLPIGIAFAVMLFLSLLLWALIFIGLLFMIE